MPNLDTNRLIQRPTITGESAYGAYKGDLKTNPVYIHSNIENFQRGMQALNIIEKIRKVFEQLEETLASRLEGMSLELKKAAVPLAKIGVDKEFIKKALTGELLVEQINSLKKAALEEGARKNYIIKMKNLLIKPRSKNAPPLTIDELAAITEDEGKSQKKMYDRIMRYAGSIVEDKKFKGETKKDKILATLEIERKKVISDEEIRKFDRLAKKNAKGFGIIYRDTAHVLNHLFTSSPADAYKILSSFAFSLKGMANKSDQEDWGPMKAYSYNNYFAKRLYSGLGFLYEPIVAIALAKSIKKEKLLDIVSCDLKLAQAVDAKFFNGVVTDVNLKLMTNTEVDRVNFGASLKHTSTLSGKKTLNIEQLQYFIDDLDTNGELEQSYGATRYFLLNYMALSAFSLNTSSDFVSNASDIQEVLGLFESYIGIIGFMNVLIGKYFTASPAQKREANAIDSFVLPVFLILGMVKDNDGVYYSHEIIDSAIKQLKALKGAMRNLGVRKANSSKDKLQNLWRAKEAFISKPQNALSANGATDYTKIKSDGKVLEILGSLMQAHRGLFINQLTYSFNINIQNFLNSTEDIIDK